jgi:hypothetical protein
MVFYDIHQQWHLSADTILSAICMAILKIDVKMAAVYEDGNDV